MDQIDALGPMPDEWWQTWREKGSKWFVGNGKPKEGRHVWTFDQRFEDAIQAPRRRKGTELIGDEERMALFEMIRGMLVFRPGDRLSASRVLRTEWMRKWAVPEAEETWGQAASPHGSSDKCQPNALFRCRQRGNPLASSIIPLSDRAPLLSSSITPVHIWFQISDKGHELG
ncbi:hypothetical protein PG987_002058 [Apiospora arundinis]